MHAHLRLISRVVLALAVCAVIGISSAQAAPTTYNCALSGAAEAPPNASTGFGNAQVQIDPVAHTMVIHCQFNALVGNTTQCHIHAATAVAGTGTAGVATTTPFFAGFPIGVKNGTYDITLDTTLASSWNPTYVTNNGGTTASAEAALFAAIAAGKAYFNVHSQSVPGGEIRGFLNAPVATEQTTWGSIKALYR